MAKPKKYISSKLKVKRKFLLGGDPGQELYLNNNTTYQAVDAPTAMLQNQFDANEQLKAKQNTAIFGNQMARQMDYLQDLNAASEQRKKEEEQQKLDKNKAVQAAAVNQVTTTGTKIGEELLKNTIKTTAETTGTAGANVVSKTAPTVAKPLMMHQGTASTGALKIGTKGAETATTTAAKTGMTATSYGSNAANLGVGLGLGLTGELIGYLGNKRDDKQMEKEGRSQYYDDTHYSRAEFNSQIGKSAFKGAGMGSSFGPVGTAIGAGVGLLYGTGKALHERRKTTGKNWFGEENVYDENLDPTVIEKRNREAQLKAMTDTATAMDNARMGSMLQSDLNTGFNLKTTTGQMAKYGGKIEYLQGGVAKSLGRGAKEYIGKSHEEGGIDLPGNIEVEGGETEQNNYIFSKHLKLHTGISYAQAHKNLLASGASSEEIKQLALSQEAAAGRNPNEIKTMKFAKYGGPLQYDKGGEKQTLKERRKERLVNKFNEEYDAQIQELAGLPEDQRAARFQEMVNEFAKNESITDAKIEDAKTFNKRDLTDALVGFTGTGAVPGAMIGGPAGLAIAGSIGLGVGAAKALGEYITSKRGTSRRLDKLEAKQIANKNFEENLINNPKGELANKYTEEFFKKNPNITNADDYLKYIQSTDASNMYDLATTVAAGRYLQGRLEDQRDALQNPPVPMKGKDAGKLPRPETPKLATYTLPNVKIGPTSTTFVSDEPEVIRDAEGNYIFRDADGTELGKSKDLETARKKKDMALAVNNATVNQTPIGVAPPANNTVTETPKVNATVTQNNPPVTTTQTQTTNNQPVVNTNPSGTVTYTTSDKAVTNKTPTGKPRFFMGASRIVDENGNVQIITDRPLMGRGNMAGSRLGTPTEQGLEDVQTNSYEQAARLKMNADYTDVEEATSGKLSSSNAVNDRETIAGTEWGKKWGYKPGMSAAEAKSAHDAFASEMRTKFDQSPDEMLGYYQYLIDNPNEYGKDAEQIKANLKAKGYIGEDGKIKGDALSYLKTQATNEFVGPIHNAAGAYTLKGKPTPVKIPGEVPETPETPEIPKKPLSELPPPPKYVPTKSTNNVGLLQTIPAAYAAVNPINVKPIAPSLANGYVTPGAVGKANIGRVSYNTERAANQGNLSAMNQALQNMSGPGAVAGMLAAKTKADQQNLAIANAEQNANIGLAAKEADLNAGISKFNVGAAMQAQTTNAGIAQQNAARMQQASQFNTQLKYAKDVENREQMLGALDRGTAAIVQNNLANRQLDATERLAGVYDAYSAYNRYLDATKKEEDKTTQTAKFGGAKKYISRLGDLKNVKYKV